MKYLKGGEPIKIDRSKNIVCLLYHGWTSTPQEVADLAYFLANKNFSVRAPLLKGHGLEPQQLEKVTYEDWFQQALTEYDELAKTYQNVIIGGSSLGANLALLLAAKRKPYAVLSLGASIYLRNFQLIKRVAPILAKFKRNFQKHYPNNINRQVLRGKVHYWSYPSASLLEMIRAMDATNKIISDIKQPTLVMQSATDHMLPRTNAEDIYYRLGSNYKRLIFVPDSYHVFTIDKWKNWVFEEIYKFITYVKETV